MNLLKEKLSQNVFNKLIAAGFDSIKTLLLAEEEDIVQRAKLSYTQVENILVLAADISISDKVQTVFDSSKLRKISTGCESINEVLHGGVPVNGILELFGKSGVGKTQFCIQLSLMVQLPETFGGLNKGAVYVSTEDAFPVKRLHQMSQLLQSKYRSDNICIDFEKNIYLEHLFDTEQLHTFLDVRLPHLLTKEDVGLLVIDSIAGVFRTGENTNYMDRSKWFLMLRKQLLAICGQYKVAVLCVNQVTDNVETNATQPSLGLFWSNLVTSRYQIKRDLCGKVRAFEVVFSPDIPEASCRFDITDTGIVTL